MHANDSTSSDDPVQLGTSFFRVLGALTGLITCIIGVVYATRVFSLIYKGLNNPEAVGSYISRWRVAIGDSLHLQVVISNEIYEVTELVVVAVTGIAVWMLIWISIQLIITGAKVISLCLDDKQAIKRIFKEALGSNRNGKT
jgi:hypothetical protein